MKKVEDLIQGIDVIKVTGDVSTPIESLSFDSQVITPNSLFVSANGVENEGHTSLQEAISSGAKAVVFQGDLDQMIPGIVYIQVADSRHAIGAIAQNFYNHPSKQLKLVGVTGTNGKTTTATLLFEIFRFLGHHTALISTVENKIDDIAYPTTHTTPTPLNLTKFLAQAVDAGAEYAFMECSSHGIEEERIAGLEFTGALFTNLTQDHLDFHGTLQKYTDTKKRFFDKLPESAFSVSNADDAQGAYMLRDTNAKKYFYSIDQKSDFQGTEFKTSLEGTTMNINGNRIQTSLIGRFNAYNILVAYAATTLLGISETDLISVIEKLTPPAGRLQFVKSNNGTYGIVDYAHTPDALENILKTVEQVKLDNARIITVFGCGGDRDTTKRPLMGSIAAEFSDYIIVTSDNPRTENPEKIIDDIIQGIPESFTHYERITNRADAIKKATEMAQQNDVIVVAGKGHETYQIFSDTTVHFSDLEELKKHFD